MKQKRVMILGAGNGQMPFIDICKSKGYYVIVVSIKGDYPGFKAADKSYYVDTKDKDKILEIAKKEQIDAILSDQTDVSVPAVAYVSEQLNLRGIGYDTALKFTNKYLMRIAAKDAGVGVPEFYNAADLCTALNEAEKIGYPVMIKPADSSGSRGVQKVNSPDELKMHFEETKKYSTTDYIIVEEFIDGREYLVDGFAMDGKYINLDLGIKEYFDVPNIFVSKMCMFSSAATITDRVEKMVLSANKQLVENMGLEFGITHAEYLYSEKKDKVYLVEVAARGGGVFLSSDITPTATGFNTNEAVINYVVEGVKRFPDKKDLLKKVSAWVCFSFPDGEIVSIDGVSQTKQIKGVYKVITDDVYIGKKTKRLCDDSGKYGPVLIEADNREDCYKIIDNVKNTLKIKIKTDNTIEDLIW